VTAKAACSAPPLSFASARTQTPEIRPGREIVLGCIFVYARCRAEDARLSGHDPPAYDSAVRVLLKEMPLIRSAPSRRRASRAADLTFEWIKPAVAGRWHFPTGQIRCAEELVSGPDIRISLPRGRLRISGPKGHQQHHVSRAVWI